MTAPAGVLEWDDLTSDQRDLLLTCQRQVDVQAFILNFDLTVAKEITGSVDNKSGNIQWDSTRTVHRDVTVTLSLDAELPWGITLLQVYKIYRDRKSGLAARRSRGVFCLTAPQMPFGSKVLNRKSRLYDMLAYPVTGQDRLYLLDRQVGRSYVIPAFDDDGNPTLVLSAVWQVLTDAGFDPDVHAIIDTSRADAELSQPLVFPMVSTSDSGSDPDSSTSASAVTSAAANGDPSYSPATDGPYTWLQILNTLLNQITYRMVWADNQGRFRVGPYVDPGVATPSHTFDARSGRSTVAMTGRQMTRDPWAAPNRWIFVWTNMPAGPDGDTPDPNPDNGGMVTIDNTVDGITSQAARNGLVWPVLVEIQAATSDDFAAQAQARVAADKRIVTTFTYSTKQHPEAEHYDVLQIDDPDVGDGPVKVQSTAWTEPLDQGDTQWQWTSV